MKRSEIKAVVTENWSHPKSKFRPGDKVRVDVLGPNPGQFTTLKTQARSYGKRYAGDHGRVGTVFAASCGPDGKLRSKKTTWYGRQYTRYYVEFENGDVRGFHSHHLVEL